MVPSEDLNDLLSEILELSRILEQLTRDESQIESRDFQVARLDDWIVVMPLESQLAVWIQLQALLRQGDSSPIQLTGVD